MFSKLGVLLRRKNIQRSLKTRKIFSLFHHIEWNYRKWNIQCVYVSKICRWIGIGKGNNICFSHVIYFSKKLYAMHRLIQYIEEINLKAWEYCMRHKNVSSSKLVIQIINFSWFVFGDWKPRTNWIDILFCTFSKRLLLWLPITHFESSYDIKLHSSSYILLQIIVYFQSVK